MDALMGEPAGEVAREGTSALWGRMFSILRALRLKPWDTSTPHGRSKERLRRIALTGSTSAFTRLAMLVAIPLAIRYLGAERYALWMTISSCLQMLTFADLGIGNGLLNAVSKCHGENDREGARSYVSSALVLLSVIAGFMLIGFSLAYPFISWARFFNLHSSLAIAEAGPAMAVFFWRIALNLPMGVVQRTEMGYQDGFTFNMWSALGAILSILGLVMCLWLHAGLPWLMLAICAAPLFANGLNGLQLFGFRKKWLRPSWSCVDRQHMRSLLGVGVYFLALQTLLAVVTNADNLIGMHLLGAREVAEYSVTMRLFSVVPMILYMMLDPLWPAYGESIARGDFAWARRTLFTSLKIVASATAGAGILLILFGGKLVSLWVHGQIHPSTGLLVGLAVWMLLSTAANAVSIFLNNANRLRAQVLAALAMTVSAIFLKFLLVPRFGLPGLVWSTNIAYIVCIWVPIALFVPGSLRKLEASLQRPEPMGSLVPAHDFRVEES